MNAKRETMAHPAGGTVVQGSFPNGVPRWLSASGSRLQALPVATGGGEPLPAQVRQAMESMFGASFAAVRVLVGPHTRSAPGRPPGAASFSTRRTVAEGHVRERSGGGGVQLHESAREFLARIAGVIGDPADSDLRER
jgi:hypothetical protein